MITLQYISLLVIVSSVYLLFNRQRINSIGSRHLNLGSDNSIHKYHVDNTTSSTKTSDEIKLSSTNTHPHFNRRLDSSGDSVVFLLFNLKDRLLNEAIWREYFSNVPESYKNRYRVVIHFSEWSKGSIPLFLVDKAIITQGLLNKHSNDINLSKLECMVHLLRTAIGSSKSHEDMFLFIDDTSIPTKSIHALVDYFLPQGVSLGGGLSVPGKKRPSSFCFMDVNKWQRSNKTLTRQVGNDTIVTQSNDLAPMHSHLVVLTQADALKISIVFQKYTESTFSQVSPFRQIFIEGGEFPNLINATSSLDISNYWFFHALFGSIDLNSTSATNLRLMSELDMNNASTVEHGNCHTFRPSQSLYHPGSPFYKIRTHFIKVDPEKPDNILNPTVQFIDDLHDSPGFFFACCFDSLHHSFYVRHVRGERLSLNDAFKRLGVFTMMPGWQHDHAAVLHSNYTYNKTSIFEMINPKEFKFMHRGKGDNGGLKVLVITIDNRDLKDSISSNSYLSYASALLFKYCKLHGYDFLKFTPNSKDLAYKANMKYDLKWADDLDYNQKYGVSVFHSGFRTSRASSWTKLPVLWYLIHLFGEHYDYFWFMDSDATISPVNANRSLYDSFQLWSADPDSVKRGRKDFLNSNFLFFNNFPWRDDLPCAGIFIFKPTAESEVIMREWWDYEIPPKNHNDFMEQDALWYQLEAEPRYGFHLNFSTATLIDNKQFPSGWYGISSLWTVHVANYEHNRLPFFKNMLRMAGLYKENEFKNEIAAIYHHHYLYFDIFEIPEAMEDYSSHLRDNGLWPPRRPMDQYPQCRTGKADDRWHWSTRPVDPPRPPTGRLYNGLPLAVAPFRSIWMVYNDTRYEFGSMDMFQQRGFDLDMVLHFRTKDAENSIPIHPNISVSDTFPPDIANYQIFSPKHHP